MRPAEAEADLWLLFAPIKRARLDWLVEKATELGASALLGLGALVVARIWLPQPGHAPSGKAATVAEEGVPVVVASGDIPYGATATYGQLAADLGNPAASRAVGLANGRNPVSIIVPCHRVVGSDGSLTGYGGGLERKRFLLDLERAPSMLL